MGTKYQKGPCLCLGLGEMWCVTLDNSLHVLCLLHVGFPLRLWCVWSRLAPTLGARGCFTALLLQGL